MKSSEISLRACENCKKSFQPKNLQHKLCSNKCRRAYQQMRYAKTFSPKPPLKLTCQYCNQQFSTKQPNQKLCSQKCREEYSKEYWKKKRAGCTPVSSIEMRRCGICAKKFLPKTTRHKYCSDDCRNMVKYVGLEVDTADTVRVSKIPKGSYVYAWFKDNEPLPFYIGKGNESRAWDRHKGAGGLNAWCETVRSTAKNFQIKIVRDNLTDEGAILIEATLINFFSSCGVRLANSLSGTTRQETPPLILGDINDA